MIRWRRDIPYEENEFEVDPVMSVWRDAPVDGGTDVDDDLLIPFLEVDIHEACRVYIERVDVASGTNIALRWAARVLGL